MNKRRRWEGGREEEERRASQGGWREWRVRKKHRKVRWYNRPVDRVLWKQWGGGRGGAVENKVHLHHKIKLTDEQDFFRWRKERNKHLSMVMPPFKYVTSPVTLLKEYLTKWAVGDMGSGVTHSVLTGRPWKMDKSLKRSHSDPPSCMVEPPG